MGVCRGLGGLFGSVCVGGGGGCAVLWFGLAVVFVLGGGSGGGVGGIRIWILGADLKAHRTPREEHDGVSDNSAYWPAMPYEMRSQGPRRTLPNTLGSGAAPWSHPAQLAGRSWLHTKASRAPTSGAQQCGVTLVMRGHTPVVVQGVFCAHGLFPQPSMDQAPLGPLFEGRPRSMATPHVARTCRSPSVHPSLQTSPAWRCAAPSLSPPPATHLLHAAAGPHVPAGSTHAGPATVNTPTNPHQPPLVAARPVVTISTPRSASPAHRHRPPRPHGSPMRGLCAPATHRSRVVWALDLCLSWLPLPLGICGLWVGGEYEKTPRFVLKKTPALY